MFDMSLTSLTMQLMSGIDVFAHVQCGQKADTLSNYFDII